MNLNELLLKKRQTILKKWFDSVLETYPQDTANFLKRQKDQFANPVGSTIYNGMDSLLEELLNGGDTDKISTFLDNIIRIRAIQDFTPSQALAFVIQLKRVVREELINENKESQFADELLAFERRADDLMLLSFDIYMKCREKIYDLKANELRNMTSKLLERANLIFEAQYRKIDLEEVLQGNKLERGE
ncbi:MAG: RsbRD N-terminal domain-containing protein [Nitrospirae bacterium]|nr:RsbRD N-terminal domain-containing protein [Nitrospirota bacterium]MDA8215563.1 RsbRD N-terminal domain-containing protein [Nitrospiraceae bacterium]